MFANDVNLWRSSRSTADIFNLGSSHKQPCPNDMNQGSKSMIGTLSHREDMYIGVLVTNHAVIALQHQRL